ncbi:GDP-fucose synthetase [candidate division WOR-1 bacterium RIFCSPHIGHO2_01_FULL_53_15]|uniref:GDP-fucose synthetase n=1 Tax=candidate division WOR-1 bacterium RIFCSPHIGHO2_01_FULL_53_15 TaxID=1802564 RepID=A0A1F4Q308_UNCSA|nr:MAG: GDP-fucose synthetase [candidate division WOR-1 bacterium RIFCSPHIGHO2_01_FULL_53_15]
MKILITGATGFLGSALCLALENEGHELVRVGSKNCDLTRQDSLQSYNSPKYDRIYHLAAWTKAGDFCLYHPGEQWIINQQINTNILAWWQKYQPQAKLIAMGTSCAYDPELKLIEDNYLKGAPIESLFTYAMSKRMLHVGLLALQKQYDLKHLTLVPSTLYGPNYHLDGRQMHFIFDLIRKIVNGQQKGEEVVLWGDGNQRRELVYLDDFVRLTLQLSERQENELINVGAGGDHSIRDFAKMICRYVGYDHKKIKYDKTRYVGARSKCLAVSKLKRIITDLKLTPLATGIEKTVKWYLEAVKKGQA